ncbi:MAG TPA: cupin domain-containing protein [Cellvibrio sp.]|nr:cupin domain-containing protein [Cellvibrio sp.]
MEHLVWQDLLNRNFDDASFAWQPFREGVDIIPLYGDATQGCSSALLRYHPGAEIPRHMHTGIEFLLILRGSQRDERGHYTVGSFLVNPVGSSHQIVSEEGCIVLAIWEKPVRFICDS